MKGASATQLPALPRLSRQALDDLVREITVPDERVALAEEGRVEILYEFLGTYFRCRVEARGERPGPRISFEVVSGIEPPPAPEGSAEEEDVSFGSIDEEVSALSRAFAEEDAGAAPRWAAPPPPPPRMSPWVAAIPAPAPAAAPVAGGSGTPQQAPVAAVAAPAVTAVVPAAPSHPFPAGPGAARMARARIRNVEDPPPLQGGPRSLEAWLAWAFRLGASDLHLPPGYPATVRILGEIITVGAPLQPELLQEMLIDALEPAQKREVQRDHSLDLAREVEGAGRFRLSVFRTVRGMSAAIRCIPTEVGSAEALNIPQSTLGLTDFRDGLVLFTGPTGSGKSTTQACLIEHLNRTADLHVLTIEDPIEYLFTSRRCLIQQRELGSHVPTFARGLRDALRENPDVIMVGELRDRDTVDMAMAGAESGHLILATLHTHNTAAAISRLVDIFPDFQRNGARAVLADVCRAVINQRLLPTREGKGIVPAVEMLRINRAVANLIRENKMFQIPQVMATHREEGMVTMERALVDLVRKRLITTDVGWRHAPDKVQFEQALMSSDPRKAKR